MDIAAWQSLYHQSPEAARAAFLQRVQVLSPSQQKAVWAVVENDAAVWREVSPHGALRGVPFAIKDLFHLKGHPTRSGGTLHAGHARRDGRLVAALRTAGAVPVGKTHLHEFAYGLTGENPHYGNVTHPRLPDRDAGGSSSGSAAAVAAGIVPFALGTDTGGSLRVPAACCGLYSWRDLPGHEWITDAFPLAPSFDTAGWLARTAADIRRVNTALRGAFPVRSEAPCGAWLSPATLGLPMNARDVVALSAAAQRLTQTSLSSTDDLLRSFDGCGPAYSILQSTEAYAVHQTTLDNRKADYGSAVWQRIDRGRRWTAAQLDDARLVMMRVRLAFARFFERHDFLVMPVSPEPTPRIEDLTQSLRDRVLALTTPVSLAGLPALTVPVPVQDGLSLGLQIVFPTPHSASLDWVLRRCETC